MHMSLQPTLETSSDNVNQRKSRRYRTTDISEHVMGSMNSLNRKEDSRTEKDVLAIQSSVCIPNSDSDTNNGWKCIRCMVR